MSVRHKERATGAPADTCPGETPGQLLALVEAGFPGKRTAATAMYIPDGDHVYVGTLDGRWSSRSTGLPPLPVNAIAVDPQDAERVWVAADLGVYESRDSGQTWQPFSNGLPNAIIGDLLFHARSRKLRAATRSRGVWELDIPSP